MMKRLEDPLVSMSDLFSSAKVHVVHSQANAADEGAAQPLQIEYSATKVVPGALLQLQRHPGIVKLDRSELAESFKMLRNQVLQRMRAEGFKVLAVTSPRRIEGKSLTAANLALALAADYDSAVLLIDADLTHHGLQTLFGLQGLRGLSDHLTDDAALAELLINPGVPRFVFLPAGQRAVLSSAELLSTKRAQGLLAEMKARYADRFIIVDLPPLLDTADALAFLPLADTTLLVVEEHTTSLQDLDTTNDLLAPFNLIGTVMSRARDDADKARAGRAPWYRRWFSRAPAAR